MATSRAEAMEWIELGLLLYEARMRMRGQIHNSNPAVVSAGITGIDVCDRVINMFTRGGVVHGSSTSAGRAIMVRTPQVMEPEFHHH